MATDLQIPYEKQALTSDTTSPTGRLTVTSTAILRRGAKVFLSSATQASKELIIERIASSTVIEVRDPSVIGSALYNCAAYLVADSAAVTQNPQVDYYASQWLRF